MHLSGKYKSKCQWLMIAVKLKLLHSSCFLFLYFFDGDFFEEDVRLGIWLHGQRNASNRRTLVYYNFEFNVS